MTLFSILYSIIKDPVQFSTKVWRKLDDRGGGNGCGVWSVAMMISVYQIINLARTDLGALIESSGSEGRRRESCGHKVPVTTYN